MKLVKILRSVVVIGILNPLVAASQEAPKYPITIGTDGSTEMWTNTPANSGAAHGTRIYCAVSHLSYDDPVVHHGQPAGAHLHTFWGNTQTNYSSSADSILSMGSSSCEGGTNNRSAYWAPTLFDENDQAVIPYDLIVYYKSFGSPGFDRNTILPIPNGLTMLANQNVSNSSAGRFSHNSINNGSALQLSVNFPNCVAVNANGAPILESADNISHLSYSSTIDGRSNDCPITHPYRIPEVIYNMRYRVEADSNWYLSSDHSAATQGESLHADYIAAWDTQSMNELVRCNIEERAACEFGNSAGDRSQLDDRHKSPDGQVLYQYGLLKTTVDQTPFGTQLTKMHNGDHEHPPHDDEDTDVNTDTDTNTEVEPNLLLKVTSLSWGSGWVTFQSGVNAGHYQWVSESCRTELSDAGVPVVQILDYFAEIGDLPEVANWMNCDVLLESVSVEISTAVDMLLKVTSLSSGSGWITFLSGANAGQYQWVSESCRAQLSDAGIQVVQINDYHEEIGVLTPVVEWQACDSLLAAISQ